MLREGSKGRKFESQLDEGIFVGYSRENHIDATTLD
jgi:hypothetical protein